MEPIVVRVDSREKEEFQKTLKNRLAGFDCVTEKLDIGDVFISGETSILVERKEIRDFLMSIRDRRLRHQLSNMKQLDGKIRKFLVVEGVFLPVSLGNNMTGIQIYDDKFNKKGPASFFTPAAVSRAMESVSAYGIGLIYSPNMQWTWHWLRARCKAQTKSKKDERYWIRNTLSDKSVDEQVLYGVSGLIGPNRAMNLLEQTGSLRKAVMSNRDELTQVKDWGKKTVDRWLELVDNTWKKENIR